MSIEEFKMHPNWRALCTSEVQWKRFVREGTLEINETELSKKYTGTIGAITGEQAKEFYEDVLKSTSSCTSVVGNDTDKEFKTKTTPSNTGSKTIKPFNNKERWLNAFLKQAQNNNVKEVQKLLQFTNCSINEQDSYGWTALMSACYAGAVDVVQLLLAHGADVHLKDRGGNTCFSLAESKGEKEVLNLLLNRTFLKQDPIELPSSKGEKILQFYCETCKMNFKDITKQQHYTSTVHLFNSKPETPTSVYYGIPCTNKGYQILVKSGWNENKGLGPKGTGHKFPLKTVLKRDRRGLGGQDPKKNKSRITHFGPQQMEVISQIAPSSKTRRQREAELSKVRQKERAWRREFADI